MPDKPFEYSEERVLHLVEQYVSDRISAEECDELNTILDAEPRYISFIREQLDTDVLLTEMLASGSSERSSSGIMEWSALRAFLAFDHDEEQAIPGPSKSSFLKKVYPAIAPPAIVFFKIFVTILVVAVVGYRISFEFSGRQTSQNSFRPFETYACISETIDVEWDEATFPFKAGAQVGSEKIKFKSGIVKLEFKNGAELILEGPTEFVVSGKRRAFCPYGKINAYIPKAARGFELSTPYTNIVDLGTEFSVVVDEDKIDLHVLEGKVEAYRDRDDRISLSAGSAIRNFSSGFVEKISLAFSACTDRRLFATLSEAFWKERAENKARYEAAVSGDPDILCRFDGREFQGLGSARILGGHPVYSSYRDAYATRIRSVRDGIDLAIPGEHDSMTLILVARIHNLDHVSRLLIGNDYYDRKGSILWQLDQTGELQFHVHVGGSGRFDAFDIPGAFQSRDLGTMTMLAVTVDGDRREIKQYKDARLLKRADWPGAIPIALGEAVVGNENVGMTRRIARFLDGDVAELLIYRRALSEEDIRELYLDLF